MTWPETGCCSKLVYRQKCRVGRSWHAEHIFSLNLTSISYSFWNKGRKVLTFWKFDGGHLGWKSGSPSPNTILEGGHPRIIPPVLLQLAQWFLRRRFLCEFPIGSYVKLSSAVGAILVEGPNRRINFWKRTIQWLFHQNFVVIEQMVSDKKIFMGISHRVLC
jgi:hypothetical protein